MEGFEDFGGGSSDESDSYDSYFHDGVNLRMFLRIVGVDEN